MNRTRLESRRSFPEIGNKPNDRTTVALVPAYNEARFIGSVVLGALLFADIVIVVDDGSTDNTAELALEAGALLVRHEENQGKGAALNSGFCKARELQTDVLITLDADGQHRPQEMSAVMAPIDAGIADIAVGSRYLGTAKSVPRHRQWGHRVFNLVTNRATGVVVTDSQSGFRAFSRQAIKVISFSSRGFSVESEMQFIAREQGLKLVDVPVTIEYRDKPKRSVLGQGLRVLNSILRLTSQYRPLLFFAVPGCLLVLSGLLFGIRIVQTYQRLQTLAIGYAFASLTLTVVGYISLSTGLILHSVRGLLLEIIRIETERESLQL